MKSKYKNIIAIFLKIALIAIAVRSIQMNSSHRGEIMNASELTSIGLNSFYFIDYNLKVKLESLKIILISLIIAMNFVITLPKINNFYEGLKEIIRIKSKNLIDYFIKTFQFLFKYILLDVLISIIIIFVTMFILNVDGVFNPEVFMQLGLMALFYTILPFLLIFIVNRIEYFIVGILALTIFADYFVYKLSILGIFTLYAILIIGIYSFILFKERKA